MPLKKQSGNMYSFVTHTWNPIKGKCSHDCEYCYCKKWGEQKPIHLDTKELKTKLVDPETGKQGLFIFVGSGTDVWAEDVPNWWIMEVLRHCEAYPNNRYLFQSKNPWRFPDPRFSIDAILGTTIETNRSYPCKGKAPNVHQRALAMNHLFFALGYHTMVTVEPILDFNLLPMVELITTCAPKWVNIGADSKGHNLPEPSGAKVRELIAALEDAGIDVKQKTNLKRILES